MTTVLTLALDEESQSRFDGLRKAHYPAELNRIAAHLTLFHTLPATEDVRSVLLSSAHNTPAFAVQVSGLRSLGKGVAYTLASGELGALQQGLARTFHALLTPQDRQGFRPHVVVQNKVTKEASRSLLADLSEGFLPWQAGAVGLDWWDYMGGPWSFRERFAFPET